MFWAKRTFNAAEYVPYQDILEKCLLADPSNYAKYVMVSTKNGPGISNDYYVGVPREELLNLFDSFERVDVSSLPTEIDCLHVGHVGSDGEFQRRFRHRKR